MSSAPREPRSESDDPAPLIEDRREANGTKRHINAARMEVRVRRIALAGLVAVPLVYFLVQSLR